MMRKLLQLVGVLAMVLVPALTLFGVIVLKDRVQITVAAGDADNGPDPLAVLRDDLATSREDVANLAATMADNFGKLHDAGEAAAATRQGQLLEALRGVDGLRQQLAEVTRRLQELERAAAARADRLQASLQRALAGAPAAAPPASSPASAGVAATEPGGASVPTPAPDARTTPGAAATSPPVPAAGAAESPPAATRFLTFAVPKAAFRFDASQQYAILPELSRVGFDAVSTLHDFTGVTSSVEGRFQADFDDPAGAWTGAVACKAATLVTGVDGRDSDMQKHLDSEHHPDIRFEIQRFRPAADGIDVARQTARGTVTGTMTIRGKSRQLDMPVRVSVDPSRRVVVEGEAPLKLSDYDVPVPSQLGLISMQDEVKIWVSLRARAQVAK